MIHLLVNDANLLDELAHGFQVVFPTLDLFIDDNTIKSFLGRFGYQFFSQRNMFLSGETEAVENAAAWSQN